MFHHPHLLSTGAARFNKILKFLVIALNITLIEGPAMELVTDVHDAQRMNPNGTHLSIYLTD